MYEIKGFNISEKGSFAHERKYVQHEILERKKNSNFKIISANDQTKHSQILKTASFLLTYLHAEKCMLFTERNTIMSFESLTNCRIVFST